jgi:hypothetical protein
MLSAEETAEETLPEAEEAKKRRAPLSQFQIAIAVMVGIAALSVVVASLRLTDQAVVRATDAREAPERFIVEQLGTLRLLAMSSSSVVPARLYLGMEECFRSRTPVPFDERVASEVLMSCGELEIGRLQAQGGSAMAEQGRRVLRETVSAFLPR